MNEKGVIGLLEEEIAFYEENLAEWLKTRLERVALIKGRELIGFFDTEEDAIREGARRFQLQPILVRRIQSEAPEIMIPALTLGILRANPSYTH